MPIPLFRLNVTMRLNSKYCKKIAQSNLGTGRIADPRGGEWTRQLHALAAQRPL